MRNFQNIKDNYRFTELEVQTLNSLLPMIEPHADRFRFVGLSAGPSFVAGREHGLQRQTLAGLPAVERIGVVHQQHAQVGAGQVDQILLRKRCQFGITFTAHVAGEGEVPRGRAVGKQRRRKNRAENSEALNLGD